MGRGANNRIRWFQVCSRCGLVADPSLLVRLGHDGDDEYPAFENVEPQILCEDCLDFLESQGYYTVIPVFLSSY